MPTPRKLIVDRDEPGFYHCVSRCVRQAFLLGSAVDRQEWMEQRIELLCSIYAIDDAAHSIMDNHVHALLRTAPQRIAEWSDEDVVQRWARLHSVSLFVKAGMPILLMAWRANDRPDKRLPDEVVAKLVAQPRFVREIRRRLSDISWFMRDLKEPMSRKANREDGVKGAFWEKRFSSYRVLDRAGVLTSMAYIDLNPLRAAIVKVLKDSKYTSVKQRIEAVAAFLRVKGLVETRPRASQVQLEQLFEGPLPKHGEATGLAPLGGAGAGAQEPLLDMEPTAYIDFVEALARQQRGDKRGTLSSTVLDTLTRMQIDVEAWLAAVIREHGSWFGTAIGSPEALAHEAVRRGAKRVIGAVRVYT